MREAVAWAGRQLALLAFHCGVPVVIALLGVAAVVWRWWERRRMRRLVRLVARKKGMRL